MLYLLYTHLSWDDKTETLEAMEKAVKLPEFGGTKSAWDSVKMPKTSWNCQDMCSQKFPKI